MPRPTWDMVSSIMREPGGASWANSASTACTYSGCRYISTPSHSTNTGLWAGTQGNDLGQIAVEPVVVSVVEPLKVLRQAAAQVHPQAVGVLGKKCPPGVL